MLLRTCAGTSCLSKYQRVLFPHVSYSWKEISNCVYASTPCFHRQSKNPVYAADCTVLPLSLAREILRIECWKVVKLNAQVTCSLKKEVPSVRETLLFSWKSFWVLTECIISCILVKHLITDVPYCLILWTCTRWSINRNVLTNCIYVYYKRF